MFLFPHFLLNLKAVLFYSAWNNPVRSRGIDLSNGTGNQQTGERRAVIFRTNSLFHIIGQLGEKIKNVCSQTQKRHCFLIVHKIEKEGKDALFLLINCRKNIIIYKILSYAYFIFHKQKGCPNISQQSITTLTNRMGFMYYSCGLSVSCEFWLFCVS